MFSHPGNDNGVKEILLANCTGLHTIILASVLMAL